MNKTKQTWQEELDELIDNDYWSYPEDERFMIRTTVNIKVFISHLLADQEAKHLKELNSNRQMYQRGVRDTVKELAKIKGVGIKTIDKLLYQLKNKQ